VQSSFAKSLEVHPDSPSPYSFVCLPVVVSPASTPHPPITSVFLFLYILRLRSCRLPSVFIRRPCLPSLPEEYETAGSLRSLGVTPVHRYCRPFRHLLAFLPFPGSAGYRSDLLQSISLWDEEGFSSCLTCPCYRAVPTTPPECHVASVSPRHVMLPSPRSRELGLRIYFFSRPPVGLLSLRPGNSLTIPKMALSVGFIGFVILRRCGSS